MSSSAVAVTRSNPPIRGTQFLVEHMGSVFRQPSLIAIEVAWRWLFGIPFLFICWTRAQQIFAAHPLESSGAGSLDSQNPWLAATQIATIIAYYEPLVLAELRWLLPSATLTWVGVSGLGRSLLLSRFKSDSGSRLPFRPVTVALLQAVWLSMLAITAWGWFGSMQWVAASYVSGPISVQSEPDLIGFAIWTIFLSLGFFTAWALISWTASVAPLLVLVESRSAISALVQSLRLGKAFSGKLAEVNLVLGIVKLALLVLAMVFSAAPLPFSDELGPQAMHFVWGVSAVFFLVADDSFQVVRLKAFLEFWKVYRSPKAS